MSRSTIISTVLITLAVAAVIIFAYPAARFIDMGLHPDPETMVEPVSKVATPPEPGTAAKKILTALDRPGDWRIDRLAWSIENDRLNVRLWCALGTASIYVNGQDVDHRFTTEERRQIFLKAWTFLEPVKAAGIQKAEAAFETFIK